MLDRLIEIFSPRAAYERQLYRSGIDAVRRETGYASGRLGRLTADWRASQASPDVLLMGDLALMRARQRQMVRDNPLMAALKRNLVAWLIGDGITLRALHAEPAVAQKAQEIWDAWCRRRPDGRTDFYGRQREVIQGVIDGDVLVVWRPARGLPDQAFDILPGDFLDHTLNQTFANGNRIVMGVEYNAAGARVAYHLFDAHPGDITAARGWRRRRVDAMDVDHVFEVLEPGQTRGVPWFQSGLPTARDIDRTKEAIRTKKRIEACLAMFRRPTEAPGNPLGERTAQSSGPDWEKLRPGMIGMLAPGEEAPTVVNPSSSGDGDGFLRSEAMQVCAAVGVPYHLGTGDVSQANYSSIRTDMVGFYMRLDDWTNHTIDSQVLAQAFMRVMRAEALRTNDRRLLEVTSEALPPPRPWVDPLKDISAKIMEARGFPGAMQRILSEMGMSPAEAAAAGREWNALIASNGLALDTDPARINGAGALQPPAGFIAARPD